jgi:hypothetical protein
MAAKVSAIMRLLAQRGVIFAASKASTSDATPMAPSNTK